MRKDRPIINNSRNRIARLATEASGEGIRLVTGNGYLLRDEGSLFPNLGLLSLCLFQRKKIEENKIISLPQNFSYQERQIFLRLLDHGKRFLFKVQKTQSLMNPSSCTV